MSIIKLLLLGVNNKIRFDFMKFGKRIKGTLLCLIIILKTVMKAVVKTYVKTVVKTVVKTYVKTVRY